MFLNLSEFMTKANLTYSILYNQLLTQIGSTYLTDINFSLAACVGFIGLFFNLMSIRVLFGGKFKSIRLFDYLKVNLINSTAVCIISTPLFIMSKRFMFTSEIYGTFYLAYIYGPILEILDVISSLIDVAILLDRITLFTRKFDFFKRLSFRTICIIALVCALLIGLQFYHSYYPEKLEAYLSENTTLRFYFLSTSSFAQTQLGSIKLGIVLFLKDVVTVTLISTFNIISVVLLRRYIAKRAKNLNLTNLNKKIDEKSTKNLNVLPVPQQSNSLVSVSAKLDTLKTQLPKSKPQTSRYIAPLNQKQKISSADRSSTQMAIVLSLLSIFEHTIVIVTNFLLLTGNINIGYITGSFTTLNISIRHSCNFLILYLFNKNFRNEIDGLIKKRT
jgi:hypothetical protein